LNLFYVPTSCNRKLQQCSPVLSGYTLEPQYVRYIILEPTFVRNLTLETQHVRYITQEAQHV